MTVDAMLLTTFQICIHATNAEKLECFLKNKRSEETFHNLRRVRDSNPAPGATNVWSYKPISCLFLAKDLLRF
jgi:hypothetical protein